MAPFVPDIISDELNLIVALFLGIGFGFVLEQAGFSSSRKLAGVFYGYDFTVLRVFFTAGVTAMVGVLFLGYFGLLDLDVIYVNPTFLGPAIVGGVIMGFGFILGGYCPGTSICAAAIGKKDGIAFVLGGILGVFVFGELFPLYDTFYTSGALGPIKIFSSLGMPQGLFVLAMILVAVGAFVVTTRIEKKVNPASAAASFPVRRHQLSAAGLVALGMVLLVLPDRKAALLGDIDTPAYRQQHPVTLMTPDELAFRVLDRDPSLQIIDVRSPGEFQKMSLPGAVNASVNDLFGKEYEEMLGLRHKKRVVVDEDGTAAFRAALLAERLGYDRPLVLQGGVKNLRSTVLDWKTPAGNVPASLVDTYRFRNHASAELAKMIEENKAGAQKPTTAVKKIAGGC